MQRRTFVKSLAAAVATAQVLPGVGEALEQQVERLRDDLGTSVDDGKLWKRVRHEFTLNPGLVHFNCGSIGATPRLVIDAIASFMRQQEADPYHNEWGGIGAGLEVVREKAAEFLRASKDEVTLTRNTTEGMNLVASGLKLKRGDEILTTNHEHGGGMVCWQYLAKHHGVKMRYMEMPNPVKNKADILERIESHISKRTRVCSFSHIDTITGLQMPMADIAQLTRPKDILLVCDGAQAPGMLNVDVKALGVDAYASSSHKWMLAPKGSGLLYVRKEAQERVQPIMLYSGYGSYSASVGTRNVPQILGHGVAMDFHNAIGRDRIEARCRQLSRLARARLRDISALTLLTPDQEELSSGVVSFALDKAKGDRGLIVKRFWDEHNIILKPAQGTYAYVPAEHVKGPHANYNPIRVSTHIFNSETEVEKMADIMKKMLA
ncbi:MAG: aminotransferase class V-fold PLP-dependent enzyme [Candidatus Latescibacterota bacterium]|jgi:selenocysteine lyase/cysteine desulfurase